MAKEFATVEIRRVRGVLRLVGLGKTGRGQRYIKNQVDVDAPKLSSPDFKDELAKAMKNLTGEDD